MAISTKRPPREPRRDPSDPRMGPQNMPPPPMELGGDPLPPEAPPDLPPPPEPEPEPLPEPEPDIPLPPMPSMPPAENLPLGIAGTFAMPGTRAALPFRSPRFLEDRVVGPTGPGTPIFGGLPGFSGVEQLLGDEDIVRRIVAGIGVRR
jgi:hypothetical protein